MSSEKDFINLALLRAAVSGRFDPLALLEEIPAERHDAVIGALSLVCEEDIVNDRFFWTLRAAVRRQQLARLDGPASVHAALDGAPTAEPDDVFATELRRLLLGEDISMWPARPAKADPDVHYILAAAEAARHSALQFAKFAPVVDNVKREAEFNASRWRIAERQQQASIDIVLPDKLFGRTAEVERLLRFAAGKFKDLRPMLVTGIAGVGKSAVLAAVLKRQLKRGHPAIQIDFDRPDLSDAGPLPIVREIMRQLELALLGPAEASMQKTATVLSAVRDAIRAFEQQQTQRASVPSQISYLLSAVYPPLLHDIDESMRTMPVLLVFDTFEIVGNLGSDAVNRVLQLEVDLRELAGLKGLRSIVSSRGVPIAEAVNIIGKTSMPGAVSAFGPPTRRITIEGLADADGADLLASRDRNRRFPAEGDRQRLSKALKGHPMALIVLELFARKRSAAEIDELVIDIESNPDFNAEFAQAFLYRRILDRLTDPEIKQLAHPGLVLRRVTPDLIRLVLAGPCKLGTMDQARAQDLFDKLQSQYWLVEAVEPGVVRHYPALRRLMLPGMFAGPLVNDLPVIADEKQNVRTATLAVCTAAAQFYRIGPAKEDVSRPWWESLSLLDREVEATYYEALSGAIAPLEIDSRFPAADLRSGFGGDFETLPVPWRALIKASSGDYRGLTDIERKSLTGHLREAAESVEIEQQLKSGKTVGVDELATQEVKRREMSYKLSEAQALLSELGIKAGRIDGVAGPITAEAIRAFQAQQGLAINGWFDDDVLARLRLEAQKVRESDLMPARTSGNEEDLPSPPTRPGNHALGGDSPGLDGDPAPVPEEPAIKAEGQGSDLALAEQQVRAAFDQLDFEAARHYARPVTACFGIGMMSEAARLEANAGQLWSTGLWEAMLALRLDGAPTPFEAFISAEYLDAPCPVGVLSAALLVGRLTVPIQADDLRRQIQRHLLPRFEFRLRSIDGLRHAALLMSDPEADLDREILFDASALSLAEPRLSELLAGVASGNRLLALDIDTDGLRPFAKALASGTATTADFEHAYTGCAAVRWPPRDPELRRRGAHNVSTFLRGLTPELHEPAARLIEGLADNDAVLLAEAIASKAVHWPSDLWFKPNLETEFRSYGFSEIQSSGSGGAGDLLVKDRRCYDPRLALTVVQSADRCGILRFALSALSKRNSRGKSLLKIHDIVNEAFFSSLYNLDSIPH
jgi:hypothetical protein